MRAHYGNAVKRLSKKEGAAVSRQAADSAFPAVMAAVLFVLYKRGWHKDRLLKLYDDVCAFLAMPAVFGKHLDDRQIEDYLEKKIGIDWSKIRKCIQIAEE
jgi:hypothetical protein